MSETRLMERGGRLRGVRRKSLILLRRVVFAGGRGVVRKMLKRHSKILAGGVTLIIDKGAYDAPPNLDELAERVERLSPSPRNPDRFHEEKSEIAECLRMLAVERGRRG